MALCVLLPAAHARAQTRPAPHTGAPTQGVPHRLQAAQAAAQEGGAGVSCACLCTHACKPPHAL